jgi:predicted RNase H-like HicB family nuclease
VFRRLTSTAQPRRAERGTGAAGCSRLLGLTSGPYDSGMSLQLTAVFQKVPEGYIGFVEELPGANTQGATLQEARENLQEAIALVLEANRELIEEASQGAEIIREPIKVGA